ncbi:MAG: hypothetical protein OEZ43_14875 [Gammaproteobacteria bacterium]|nr:hypothetical protein [Gammaproteobacteria bacterium]
MLETIHQLRRIAGKLSIFSPNDRRRVFDVFLRYKLRNTQSAIEVGEYLRIVISRLDNDDNATALDHDSLLMCLSILGNRSGYLIPENPNDWIPVLKSELELMRAAIAKLCRSNSKRSMSEYIAMLESEQTQRKRNTELALEELISTVLDAFEPNGILRRLSSSEEDRKWLEKNDLFIAILEKYEAIEKYKSSGTFVRDFWIMYKMKQSMGI